jgi:hypothetical protein
MAKIARCAVVLLFVLALPAEATSAPPRTTFEFQAKRAKLAADPTVVVLDGTYSCGPFTGGVPERGVVDLTVRQAQVTGFGFFEPTVCDGTRQRFAASVTAVSGSFRRGPATWSASGFLEGIPKSQNVFVPDTPIRIKH